MMIVGESGLKSKSITRSFLVSLEDKKLKSITEDLISSHFVGLDFNIIIS